MKELSLKNKRIQIDFLLGYCSLSYKNIILTKNLGLYSSIYHEQKWFDSRFATWEVIEITQDKLKLYGEWINAPHRQTWDFILTDNTLQWNITCKNLNNFTINMIQQNFMLNEMYTSWKINDYAAGKFPEFFTNYNGLLWDRIWSSPKIKGVEVILSADKTKKLPLLKIVPPLTEPNALIAIENTSPNDSARIIQTLFINPSQQSIAEDYSITLQTTIKIEENDGNS
ncbi:MAG: hypothetical protein P9M06_00240 [Candidatus Saelkia tenebricola]|nr:hypothetical protein [Candidatus Saelkia tenebricola]